MSNAIYLDYNATTPIKPDVLDLMCDVLRETGNASSVHKYGRSALLRIEKAREQVAEMCGTHPNYITFTSGATEANNSILQHFAGRGVLVSSIEHPSVLKVLENAHALPVTPQGDIDLEALDTYFKTLTEAPALLSVMLVNNETGVIQPVAKIARLARKHFPQIHIHTDAAQAAGKIKIDFPALGVDYLSLSSHKFGGPQGVGALIKAPGADDALLLRGGGQEKRQRAGTENVAGIAAMGAAAALATNDLPQFEKLSAMRDRIEETLKAEAPELKIFGKDAPRTANTTSLCLPGIASETQLMAMDLAGIAVSNGSACSSGKVMESHVLRAMGAGDNEAGSALRISIGWETTENDIDKFIEAWTKLYQRVKNKITV